MTTTAEANPNAQPGRTWSRKGRSSPRHPTTVRRVLRVGQMAWEGRSAGEIADEIGVGTQYVYQICSDYRIPLAKKTRAEYSFRVTLQLRTVASLEKIASEREEGVPELVARMIDALSNEPVLLSNLLEEAEDEPQPRRRPRKSISSRIFADDPEGED
jgi:hypothetical protein